MADDTLSVTYDVRRKARGGEPAIQARKWKMRLLVAGGFITASALAVAGLFIYWAFTFVYTIRAEVRGSSVILSPDFDARLAAIEVVEGQEVEAGQELARFDDTERRAALSAAEAGVNLKESQHAASKTALASSQAGLEVARIRVQEEINRAEANCKSTTAWMTRLKNGTRPEDLEAAGARLASARALAALYTLQLKQSQKLHERGIESEIDLEIRKTQLTTQNNVVREAELVLKKLKAGARKEEIEEAEQVVKARQADLALARAGLNGLRRLELDLEDKQARLRQSAAELERSRAEVVSRRAALDNMVLKSPITGTVVQVFFKAGEVVRKGEVTVEVADDTRGRWVEAFVLEEDSDKIKPGQPAHVEIVIDSGEWVTGKVEKVGMSKARPMGGRSRSFSETGDYGRPAPVWVLISLDKIRPEWRPGTSAQASIRFRD